MMHDGGLRPIADKRNREVNRVLATPDVEARLDRIGFEVAAGASVTSAKRVDKR
jgi:hypothetical protein